MGYRNIYEFYCCEIFGSVKNVYEYRCSKSVKTKGKNIIKNYWKIETQEIDWWNVSVYIIKNKESIRKRTNKLIDDAYSQIVFPTIKDVRVKLKSAKKVRLWNTLIIQEFRIIKRKTRVIDKKIARLKLKIKKKTNLIIIKKVRGKKSCPTPGRNITLKKKTAINPK